jgi:hypothetical protein
MFNLGSWVGLLSISAWLSRRIIIHFLDKDLDKYKAGLKAAYDSKLEEIKTGHVIAELEHEIRFRNLHEKRFELIAELYSRLDDTHRSMQRYTQIMTEAGDLPEQDRCTQAAEKYNAMQEFYSRHKIFFTHDECERIDEYTRLLLHAHIDFSCRKLADSEIQTWISVRKKMDNEIDGLRKTIQDKFRNRLGIAG